MKWANAALLGLLGICLAACSTAPARTGFSKVKTYRLEEKMPLQDRSSDRMISFESDRRLYGAVTEADRQKRFGHYYTFFWTTEAIGRPHLLRFEYRQAVTGNRILRVEQPIPRALAKNTTAFAITGEPYQKNGRVVAWRCQVLRDGQVLDSTASFLWR